MDKKKKKDNLLRMCLVRGLGEKRTKNVLKECRRGKKNFSYRDREREDKVLLIHSSIYKPDTYVNHLFLTCKVSHTD